MGKKRNNIRSGNSVVKIDSKLLRRVRDYINKPENQFKFVNNKQFIDIAVYEKLKKEEKNGKKTKHR